MPWVNTAEIDIESLTPHSALQIYCALDSATLHEIHSAIEGQMDKYQKAIYAFNRKMQKPALQMMLRGILVDPVLLSEVKARYAARTEKLEKWINRLANVIQGKPLNPNSPMQMQELFYRRLDIAPIYKYEKGKRKITTNREALEKIIQLYFWARPIAKAILEYRDCAGKVRLLSKMRGKSGRFRANYNVVGTETGRWSSSAHVTGEGSNAQNITEELREPLIPDPGMKIAYADLEQAESVVVGYLSGDANYIAAIESGDLHTYCCRLMWEDLPWTGDLTKDKAIAGEIYYRIFTKRDIMKRGGHASNYYGKASTLAKILRIPEELMDEFQYKYFEAFPDIRVWHGRIHTELVFNGYLITPAIPNVHLGRKRWFLGRREDDATLREAIAYKPQSLVGDILNEGLYRMWRDYDAPGYFEVLGQVHDAIVFQFEDSEEGMEYAQRAVDRAMRIPVPFEDREMVIKTEVKAGYDWRNLAILGSDAERQQNRRNINMLDMVLP